MSIVDLPVEVLIHICSRLPDQTLNRLRLVCKFLCQIVDNESLWKRKFHSLRIHNPTWSDFQKFTWRENYVASFCWKNKVPRHICLVSYRKRFLPWLQSTDDHLFISRGNQIETRSLKDIQQHSTSRNSSKFASFSTPNFSDIGNFVVNDDYVFAGTCDGHLCAWRNSAKNRKSLNCQSNVCIRAHEADVHAVASIDRMVITGSKDEHVKIWQHHVKNNGRNEFELKSDILIKDRIWTLHANEVGNRYFAVGSAAIKNCCAPLSIFDIERSTELYKLGLPARKGAGVSDVKFRDENTVFACGYDSMIRLYDLRTNKSEWEWYERYDSNIFCLVTDKLNSVIVGTSHYGFIWFLDLRWKMPIRPELYANTRNSPVYSLAANTKSLFVSLDCELHQFYV